MKRIPTGLQTYHAWANEDLLNKMREIAPVANAAELTTALRLVNHYFVVASIFRGHLTATPHGFTSDNTPETPTLDELTKRVHDIDDWYQSYLSTASDAQLAEAIPFTFTDGDKGMMTRAEMITHVMLHAGYHRGEVGRLLWGLGITPPWDTYAVHLHQSQPERREQRTALLS